MLGENITKFRKEANISQEKMAEELNVVRQTVSKWEKGISAPDAEMLVKIALLLDVSVNELLDINSEAEDIKQLKQLLDEKNEQTKLTQKESKIRGKIISLTFIAMIVMLAAKNAVLSIVLSGILMIMAVMILYKNLPLMIREANEREHKAVKSTTVFTIVAVVVCIAIIVLMDTDIISLSEEWEKIFAVGFISCVMIFAGYISPQLPFNRYTGLRLPWTVQDEKTWRLAHRLIGYISLPLVLIYIACAITADKYFEAISAIVLCLWIGVPSVVSWIYFMKKIKGKI